jgi:hypothetical protein
VKPTRRLADLAQMTEQPTFVVGDLFDDDDDAAAFMALFLATRHLHTTSFSTRRGFAEGDNAADREFIVHKFLAEVATIREIFDLFQEADRRGLFASISDAATTHALAGCGKTVSSHDEIRTDHRISLLGRGVSRGNPMIRGAFQLAEITFSAAC